MIDIVKLWKFYKGAADLFYCVGVAAGGTLQPVLQGKLQGT